MGAYIVAAGLVAGEPDNPDQRIDEDVNRFVTGSLNLAVGGLRMAMTLSSFAAILCALSSRYRTRAKSGRPRSPGRRTAAGVTKGVRIRSSVAPLWR